MAAVLVLVCQAYTLEVESYFQRMEYPLVAPPGTITTTSSSLYQTDSKRKEAAPCWAACAVQEVLMGCCSVWWRCVCVRL